MKSLLSITSFRIFKANIYQFDNLSNYALLLYLRTCVWLDFGRATPLQYWWEIVRQFARYHGTIVQIAETLFNAVQGGDKSNYQPR